jgi:acyl-CoA thioester hydrolase
MKLPITRTPIQIRYFDIDTLGHVSNSAYLQYCDMGRMDFFTESAKIAADGKFMNNVVANINMDFVHEILLEDRLYVLTWCQRIGNKSMTLKQFLFANEQLAARVTITLVGWDKARRCAVAIPSNWQISDTSQITELTEDQHQ